MQWWGRGSSRLWMRARRARSHAGFLRGARVFVFFSPRELGGATEALPGFPPLRGVASRGMLWRVWRVAAAAAGHQCDRIPDKDG